MEESDLRWFALKVFYNKVFDIADMLKRQDIKSYIPLTAVIVDRNGVKKLTTRPLISSLMFMQATPENIITIQAELEGKALIYSRRNGARFEPVAIPEKEMNIFMLVTSSGESGVEYIGEDSPRYHEGELVRVIDGPFKGSEGHIARIKNDHRLVVTVKGLCAVATSYIPRCFLQKVNSTDSNHNHI